MWHTELSLCHGIWFAWLSGDYYFHCCLEYPVVCHNWQCQNFPTCGSHNPLSHVELYSDTLHHMRMPSSSYVLQYISQFWMLHINSDVKYVGSTLYRPEVARTPFTVHSLKIWPLYLFGTPFQNISIIKIQHVPHI